MPFCRPLLLSFLALALAASGSLLAQPAEVPPPPPPPAQTPPTPPPPAARWEEELEPEVTIIEQGEGRVEQYTLGGEVYMVKIVPSKGVPYYLIDMDGDGSLETHRGGLDNPSIHQWILLRW